MSSSLGPFRQHQEGNETDLPHTYDNPIDTNYAREHAAYERGYRQALADAKKIDVVAYAEWAQRWIGHCDAWAGLDDISGDWRRSLANYAHGGFPTFHDTDPPELLDDLIAIAKERNNWLGLGLKPPREGKERWVRESCDRIPNCIHVHAWAMRRYTHVRRIDSVDSTNWWRDAMKLRITPGLEHLTYGECLAIVVKRYKRWTRTIIEPSKMRQGSLLTKEFA